MRADLDLPPFLSRDLEGFVTLKFRLLEVRFSVPSGTCVCFLRSTRNAEVALGSWFFSCEGPSEFEATVCC